MDDGDKNPTFVHTSPIRNVNSIDRNLNSPESVSLKPNKDATELAPINGDQRSNIQLIQPANNNISDEDNNNISDDKEDPDSTESEPEPIQPKRIKKSPAKYARMGYAAAATQSYSDLQNASMYSLKENESIIDMNNNDNENNDDGWPIFEPISGPYPYSVYIKDYKQLKNEILSGLVVSFAQVPEAVAFSFLAGVDPFIGLHAAWIVGFITSFFGGRCAEISGATGATAAVLAPYMADPNVGVMYLPYIIGLVGIIIILWGFMNVSKMISMVPVSCMIGFVNGLAVIIASAQLGTFEALSEKHEKRNAAFWGELAWTVALIIITFVIVEYLPRLTKFVPATLIGILFATFVEHVIIRMACGMETVLIRELGEFAGGLPRMPGIHPYWDDMPPLNWETFGVILLPSLTVALVSTVEDLLTIEVVHDLTNTRPRSVEKCLLITKLQIIAMGAGNLVCGFFGAIGGGSTIGLSTVNCYSANGRYRWSGVVCSISTFFIVFVASPALEMVPAGALVGLMLVVVVHTFEWSSIPILIVTFLPLSARDWLNDKVFKGKWNVHRKIRRADGIIIILVTVLTILTNLGYAIIAGVVFATFMYTWDSSNALQYSTITIKRVKNTVCLSAKQASATPNSSSNGIDNEHDRKYTAEKECVENKLNNSSTDDEDEGEYEIVKIYTLEGPLLFSNANQLPSIFNWNGDPLIVEVHLQNCTVYDYTAINALNNVAEKYEKKDKRIHLKYINIHTKKSFQKSKALISNFTYDLEVDVDDQQQFTPYTRLNVAHGSRRQL